MDDTRACQDTFYGCAIVFRVISGRCKHLQPAGPKTNLRPTGGKGTTEHS